MTQMTKQQFDNYTFQKPDDRPEKERREKSDNRLFWCLWVPLGAVAGFFACVVGDSGAFLIPVWGITTFMLWAGAKGLSE